jgi:hypothetical protein
VQPSAVADFVARGALVAAGLREALESTDACVITTNAPEFEAVPDELEAIGGSDYVVVDARRLLDPLSFTGPYVGVGRGPARREEIEVGATIGPR